MLLNKLTAFAALAVALVATQVAETHPHALALNALLGKRQQTTPPTDTTPVPTPSPTPTDGADNGDQASAPTDLPAGLAPFQDASNLTAWQVLELHPSFTNVSSIARAHSPAVVEALNSTDPGTNLTVFAPYDPAFEALVNQPLFQFANSTDRYDALISQALAYHASNATGPSGGAIYTDDIPPQPGNLTVPTLAGNLNVTLQRANERPAPPVQISQETITVPSPTVTVPSPTVTVPSPTITPPVTVVRPTGNTTPTQTATATATDGAGAGVGGPLPTQGEGVYANDAQIIYANLTLANGVLHVVDRLVSPLFIFNNPDIIGTVLPTTLPTAQPTATATATA